MRTLSVWEDLTVCDFLYIIDSWKLVGLGKMEFKAQTCWTDLLAFWGVWNRSRILNFGPDRLFFRFSRVLVIGADQVTMEVMLAYFLLFGQKHLLSLWVFFARMWDNVDFFPLHATIIYHNNLMYRDRKVCANSIGPDQMPQIAASDPSLHCLPLIQQFLDKSAGFKIDLFTILG